MNLWLILVPVALALLVLVGMAVAAACGVDGFRGDKRRAVPVAASVAPVERPAPVAVPRGPIRVASERVTQVEAA